MGQSICVSSTPPIKNPDKICSLKYSVKQFLNDYYASGDKLFCQFCQHNDDWKHLDKYKNYLQSQAQVKNTTKCEKPESQ